MSETARKYALTKVAASDYLLPSNDGSTIWRFTTYEDGPSHGLLDWPRDRKVWGAWRWAEPFIEAKAGYVDTAPDAWYRWEQVAGPCYTRREAIEAVLS